MPGRPIELIWKSNPTLYAPTKYRRACTYTAFVPDALRDIQFTLEPHVAGVVSEAEDAIRTLNGDARPALAPLARLLLRSESIASSKVEGMHLGVRELADAEARAETGRKASQTALEILANIDAMELAVHEAAAVDRFGIAEIQAIHNRLMANSNARIAGQLRTEQNWIGGNDYNPCGADYVPPPPENVTGLLEDLCDAVNDDRLPPLVQAALVHAQFETIHPFDDGNGRTGRALIHVVLRRRGLSPAYVPPISIILADTRADYIAGLRAFRGSGIAGWVEQFAESAAAAARLARAYLAAVTELKAHWRAQLDQRSSPRSDAAAWALIDILPAHPMITAPIATAVIGRAKAAVYQALQQLEDAGVLIPLSKSRRNQSWEAAGLLDLVTGLEAGRFPVVGATRPS